MSEFLVQQVITDMLGMYQFAPALSFINQISKRLCSNVGTLLKVACSNTMFLFLGFNPNQIVQVCRQTPL